MRFPNVDLGNIAKVFLQYTDQHKPALLAAMGIGFGYLATARAAKKGIEAQECLDDAMRKHAEEHPDEPFTKKDELKVTLPCYTDVFILSAMSTLSIVFSVREGCRREAAAWSCAQIIKQELDNHKQAVRESMTDRKAENIDSKANNIFVKKESFSPNEVINTGGTVLCLDKMSGRKFTTNIDRIKRAEAVINQRLYEDIFVSLNELYYELGLDDIELGDLIGWKNDNCPIHIDINTQITNDGEPCLVIGSDELTAKYRSYY